MREKSVLNVRGPTDSGKKTNTKKMLQITENKQKKHESSLAMQRASNE